MIDLYHAGTPNGHKLTMFFEETGMEHRLIRVDLGKGEQYRSEFLAISPNNKIPALVDHAPADGGAPLAMFESGAMLLYLADKCGQLIPADLRERLAAIQWLFWQVAGLGPMAGQNGHFRAHAPESLPYAIERYTHETTRLYKVLNQHLAGREFVAGAYSIADIACYPWVVPHASHGQQLGDFPHLQRWFHGIAARPATQRAYKGAKDTYSRSAEPLSDQARRVLFGAAAAQAR